MVRNVVFDMGKVLLDFNVERYLLRRSQLNHEQTSLLTQNFVNFPLCCSDAS